MPSVRISYLTQFTTYEMQSNAYELLIPASHGSSYTGSINVGYFINEVIPNSEHEIKQQETLSYHTNTLKNHENTITYHTYQLQTHDNELNVQQTEIQKHDNEISYQNIRISHVEDINVWAKFPIEN